jgi:hypothetical protein
MMVISHVTFNYNWKYSIELSVVRLTELKYVMIKHRKLGDRGYVDVLNSNALFHQ